MTLAFPATTYTLVATDGTTYWMLHEAEQTIYEYTASVSGDGWQRGAVSYAPFHKGSWIPGREWWWSRRTTSSSPWRRSVTQRYKCGLVPLGSQLLN